MNFAKPLFTMAALASLTLSACTVAPGEVEGPTGEVQEAALNNNALNNNALNNNALNNNALNNNALLSTQLSAGPISGNPLLMTALEDPNAREVFKYITSCALPNGKHINVDVDGTTYNFEGSIGLAPQWGEPGGSCDGMCQEWISACLLSRLDYVGAHVLISSRGENPALSTSVGERAAFRVREATYFGNVFQQPQLHYACLSPGQTSDQRVCGPSLQGCAVQVLGTCDKVCGPTTADGAFTDCRVPAGVDHAQVTYHGSVTVFLHP